MLNSCRLAQAVGMVANQGPWGRCLNEGSCESGWEEKVGTTSHLITTESFKEDVINTVFSLYGIRKQRSKERK